MDASRLSDLQARLEHFPRLDLAHLPTPLEPLKRLTAHLGGPRLWGKREDCTGAGPVALEARGELAQQSAALGFTPDAIVHCSGSAGTQLALDQPLLPTPQRSVPLPVTRSRTSYLVPSEPSSARTI